MVHVSYRYDVDYLHRKIISNFLTIPGMSRNNRKLKKGVPSNTLSDTFPVPAYQEGFKLKPGGEQERDFLRLHCRLICLYGTKLKEIRTLPSIRVSIPTEYGTYPEVIVPLMRERDWVSTGDHKLPVSDVYCSVGTLVKKGESIRSFDIKNMLKNISRAPWKYTEKEWLVSICKKDKKFTKWKGVAVAYLARCLGIRKEDPRINK